MADWIALYSTALDERDAREQAQKRYIDAYTKLADRTAALENAAAGAGAQSGTEATITTSGKAGPGTPSSRGAKSPMSPEAAAAAPDVLARLRTDLASTQRSRAELQTQLGRQQAEVASLSAQTEAAARLTAGLVREKRELERRLRDRDEEVRQRQRLVENVHDEMAGLNLELNMAEQKADRIKAENEMLVKRWMDKMGEEAEKMNVDSKWH